MAQPGFPRVWGSESCKTPGLPQLVTRPAARGRQRHGCTEPAAADRAAVGPRRGPELLRGLGAASGLVSRGRGSGPPDLAARAPWRTLGSLLFLVHVSVAFSNLQLAFLLYNDQPPKASRAQDSSSHGHTKGVLLLDQEGGLWLVHSVPRFPPPPSASTYSWPHNAETYGQMLLCVSFPLGQFQSIGRQLAYTYPLVYDHQLNGVFAQKFPDLEEVIQGHHVSHEPWNSSVTLTSQEGATFQSFAKAGRFGDDLYSGWLAAALRSNLQVQFWQNSPGVLPSNCSGTQQVLDVTQTAFPGPAGPTFSATEDHSKWCVAPEGPWACVGDMNRNRGEEHRGGGTLCSRLPALWKAFQPLVKAWQPCRQEEEEAGPGGPS